MYLGGMQNASNMKELKVYTNVGFILNMAVEIPNFFPRDFKYLKIDAMVL